MPSLKSPHAQSECLTSTEERNEENQRGLLHQCTTCMHIINHKSCTILQALSISRGMEKTDCVSILYFYDEILPSMSSITVMTT